MRIGFTCGTFDLMHAGHVAMFAAAKEVCDFLLVGIKIDPSVDNPRKNKPIQSIVERQMIVESCEYVDKTIVYETEKDLLDILSIFKIHVRIAGEDHLDNPSLETRLGEDHLDNPSLETRERQEICKKRGIEIYYNERKHRFSTSELRKRIK